MRSQPDINSFTAGSSLIKAGGLHAGELNRENDLKGISVTGKVSLQLLLVSCRLGFKF